MEPGRYLSEVPNVEDGAMRNQPKFLVVQLNDRWRVIDESIQWILQYRRRKVCAGAKSSKNKAWEGRRFCRTRPALLRDIRENCGEVDPDALATIEELPDWHPDHDKPDTAKVAK